jgi:hypothetical protein
MITGMEISLVEFIEKAGDKQAADLFGVEERTAASWRRMERKPRDRQAQIIVTKTRNHKLGSVTYAGIYAAKRPH